MVCCLWLSTCGRAAGAVDLCFTMEPPFGATSCGMVGCTQARRQGALAVSPVPVDGERRLLLRRRSLTSWPHPSQGARAAGGRLPSRRRFRAGVEAAGPAAPVLADGEDVLVSSLNFATSCVPRGCSSTASPQPSQCPPLGTCSDEGQVTLHLRQTYSYPAVAGLGDDHGERRAGPGLTPAPSARSPATDAPPGGATPGHACAAATSVACRSDGSAAPPSRAVPAASVAVPAAGRFSPLRRCRAGGEAFGPAAPVLADGESRFLLLAAPPSAPVSSQNSATRCVPCRRSATA